MADVVELARRLASEAPVVSSSGSEVVVSERLEQLARLDNWDVPVFDFVDQLARRFEVSSTLRAAYGDGWRPIKQAEVLPPAWMTIWCVTLYRCLLIERDRGADRASLLKRANTLLKAREKSELDDRLGDVMLGVVDNLLAERPQAAPRYAELVARPRPSSARQLPLTILFSEGPIARAYLAALAAANCRPERIIALVSDRDVATKRPIGRWLPAGLRTRYAARMHDARMNGWPRTIARTHSSLHRGIQAEIHRSLGFDLDTQQAAIASRSLRGYCDDLALVLTSGLRDPEVARRLQALAPATILYTGGGILPPALLHVDGVRFLHVHPGYLPTVRGADGLLWSTVVFGAPSVSAFYMAQGIDTGDVVSAAWAKPWRFSPTGRRRGYSDPVSGSVCVCRSLAARSAAGQTCGSARWLA